MNQGPLVFLGVFVTLVTSWFGMIFMPQLQLGSIKPVAADVSGGLYPVARPGQAQQGAEVYRQQGCYYCHSQQVRQTDAEFEIVLLKAGENTNDLAKVIAKHNPQLGGKASGALSKLLSKTPQTVLDHLTLEEADKVLSEIDGIKTDDSENTPKAEKRIRALGHDLARGWGVRRTVAADYVFERSAMLGEQRIGPDLASVGQRRPIASWHYNHLYAPKAEVPDSKMPSYKFLFEERKIGRTPSPDALKLPPAEAKDGYEVVPKPEAKALVAYLLSLKVTTPVYEAPLYVEPKKLPAATNTVTTAKPAP